VRLAVDEPHYTGLTWFPNRSVFHLVIRVDWCSFVVLNAECPNCGAELEPGARACPACGSDENTGWSEAAKSDGLDLPDDSFDYEEFVKREFEQKSSGLPGLRWLWWVAAVVVVAALLLAWLKG
jgi:hypothetical protein